MPDKIEVILVDEQDRQVGTQEKLAAHRAGVLHRAFSIFIFNSKGQMFLQKRAPCKCHSGELWSNACCSHPRPGEELLPAAHRRLQEELGFDCPLREVGSFIYKVDLGTGVSEHEFDHVLVGQSDATPKVDPKEASEWALRNVADIQNDLQTHPELFSYWFPLALKQMKRE